MATKRKADFLRSRLGWAGVFLGAVAVVVVIGIISVLDAWKFVGECAVSVFLCWLLYRMKS